MDLAVAGLRPFGVRPQDGSRGARPFFGCHYGTKGRRIMKRILIVLVLLVCVVAAVGFYRGWFTVGWERTDGKGQVTGTVDNEKIEADKKRAEEELRHLKDHKGGQSTTTRE
jgi:hypothetical protein